MASSFSRAYDFREDLLPISLLVTRRTLRVDDVEPIFEHYRELCRRRIQFVSISDVRAAQQIPDAKTRQRIAEAALGFKAVSEHWSLGAGIVLESTVIRCVLMAIEWIARPKTPTAYFRNMPDAIDWAIARLDDARIPVTVAIRDFRRTAV
jgi:hypothetical protein